MKTAPLNSLPKGNDGCDLYISTSSAGGGLQMMVAGVIAEMTAASAKRAALGAGAHCDGCDFIQR